jgi:hypothetical protein
MDVLSIAGLAKKATEFVPNVKKTVQETRNLELEQKRLERELSLADKHEAWRRAECFVPFQAPNAIAALAALAQQLAEVQLVSGLWRTARLQKLVSDAEAEKLLLALNKAIMATLQAVAKATFYFADSFGSSLRSYLSYVEPWQRAVTAAGATMASTEEMDNELAERFIAVRLYLRWRLDPVETLRMRDVLMSLETPENQPPDTKETG